MPTSKENESPVVKQRNQFGTFGGVFTPSILTILGVIMFMRAGFVIGEAGILGAVLILVIAKAITFFTTLSVGAISTNTPIRGGGAYFLISRVLGPEFGGAIGVALFLAQALSVPFYILGFTEAVVLSIPPAGAYFEFIALGTAAVLFVITYIGAGWAIKTQYGIMAVLALSIISFLGGAAVLFSPETFTANLSSDYTVIESAITNPNHHSFWMVFAIYFPAVTGIFAGINMSGDLKDPARSIPWGTLAAVGVGFLIYLLQILLCGGAYDRADLIARPFEILKENALLGGGLFIIAGVFAATLSSALGSFMGAPRILQAVGRDRILNILRPFARGSVKGDEPRRALVLTGVITVLVLLWAGDGSGGGALNIVASIITMVFLYAYGMTNMAAFTEAFGGNPSFRPRFRLFHWTTALAGALACVAVSFLIDPLAAIGAVLFIAFLLWFIKRKELTTAFGDARRGFFYSAARKNLLRLARMEEDPKNWRPTILVFSGNPNSREALVTYSVWMESGRGFVLLASVLTGSFEEHSPHRFTAEKQLQNFCDEKNINAFSVAAVAEDFEHGMTMILQTASVGPIRPNLAAFGWKTDKENLERFGRYLRIAADLGHGLLLLNERGLPSPVEKKRIDVWWRGRKNGNLMLLLAHLIVSNWDWARTRIRILRVIENEEGRAPTEEALASMIREARVEASAQIIVSSRSFTEILHDHSNDATCVFLGFEPPEEGREAEWHSFYESLLENMPTTILVSSLGREDMTA